MTGSIEPFARKRGVTMIRKINSSDFSARPASIIPRAWISHSSAELPITVNNTLLLGAHNPIMQRSGTELVWGDHFAAIRGRGAPERQL